ncbi:hypothetical protein ACN082_09920 [Rothia sp. CCM 9417]|uniref:hypothetical protein n=1 Tax=Rothia sp. CCM 9417 TaxID=3402657 RepID=UPI003AE53430
MTEITAYQQNVPAMQAPYGAPAAQGFNIPAHDPSEPLSELVRWAQETDAAAYIAGKLAKTSFVPREFQGNEANVTAAILEGKSLGMDPMEALKSIYVVHGRPGLYAKAMLKMITKAGHKLNAIERSDTRVVLRAVRKDDPSVSVDYDWTIERATRAGYTSNAKYKTNPTEMLHWKAVSEAAKFTFSDVFGGIDSVEDIEDGDFDPNSAPTPAEAKAVTAGAKKVQRKAPAKAKAAPAPSAPPAPVVTPPAESEQADPETGELPAEPKAEVKYASKADQGRIKAGFGELGVTDAKEILGIVRDWVNDPSLRGAASLTHDQAQAVLTRLAREIEIEKANAVAPAQ